MHPAHRKRIKVIGFVKITNILEDATLILLEQIKKPGSFEPGFLIL